MIVEFFEVTCRIFSMVYEIHDVISKLHGKSAIGLQVFDRRRDVESGAYWRPGVFCDIPASQERGFGDVEEEFEEHIRL